jgi:hypothetical protein
VSMGILMAIEFLKSLVDGNSAWNFFWHTSNIVYDSISKCLERPNH